MAEVGRFEMSPFRWTGRREEAAALVAEDRLSNEEIAARLGVSRQALDKWKRHADFRERVAELVEATRRAVLARGISDRACRLAALGDRWRRMNAVIEARAADMASVPGGESGLLVRQAKLVKVYELDGEDGDAVPVRRVVVVEEYSVDTGLLRELREHEKQAAQERGEWVEKREHSGEMLVREYVGVDVGGI